MTVTAITCTGDRPICFKKCCEYMKRQLLQPDQWIIVDDGVTPMENIPREADYYRLDHIPNAHTLPRNMRFALPKVEGDKVVIFEDDDYYSKHYISEITKPDKPLVGGGTIYAYHVKTGKYIKSDFVYGPAFAQMCFIKELIPVVYDISTRKIINIDVVLWKEIKGFALLTQKPLLVSIKAMPGRSGATTLHDENQYMDIDDGEVKSWFDEEWAEEDMNFYLRFLIEKPKYGIKDLPLGAARLGNVLYVPGGDKNIMALMDTMYKRRDTNRWTV